MLIVQAWTPPLWRYRCFATCAAHGSARFLSTTLPRHHLSRHQDHDEAIHPLCMYISIGEYYEHVFCSHLVLYILPRARFTGLVHHHRRFRDRAALPGPLSGLVFHALCQARSPETRRQSWQIPQSGEGFRIIQMHNDHKETNSFCNVQARRLHESLHCRTNLAPFVAARNPDRSAHALKVQIRVFNMFLRFSKSETATQDRTPPHSAHHTQYDTTQCTSHTVHSIQRTPHAPHIHFRSFSCAHSAIPAKCAECQVMNSRKPDSTRPPTPLDILRVTGHKLVDTPRVTPEMLPVNTQNSPVTPLKLFGHTPEISGHRAKISGHSATGWRVSPTQTTLLVAAEFSMR